MCFSPQRRAILAHQMFEKCSETDVFCTFLLPNVRFATAACIFFDIWTYKSGPNTSCFHMFSTFSLRNARMYLVSSDSRASGMQFWRSRCWKSGPKLTCFVHFYFKMHVSPQPRAFFNIWTYKSGPNTSCFVHFHFQMCLSPQGRAFFRQENSKKCFGPDVFCTFSLQNVVFATAACNFWFLPWPPDSAPAALTGLLFDWPDTRIIEKTQHFATSLTFGADVSSFFWLSLYCIFFCWLDYSTLLFNCPYCRKFLFKFPSIIGFLLANGQ